MKFELKLNVNYLMSTAGIQATVPVAPFKIKCRASGCAFS